MTDLHDQLTALVRQAQHLASHPTPPRSTRFLADEKDVLLGQCRTIAGLCANAIERLRPAEGQASAEVVEAVQGFLAILRLCTQEHDRITQEEAARREEARRWSEVRDEFDAAQREGRPMRSEWSWERQPRWEGPIT
jgi:hypothetical protein